MVNYRDTGTMMTMIEIAEGTIAGTGDVAEAGIDVEVTVVTGTVIEAAIVTETVVETETEIVAVTVIEVKTVIVTGRMTGVIKLPIMMRTGYVKLSNP